MFLHVQVLSVWRLTKFRTLGPRPPRQIKGPNPVRKIDFLTAGIRQCLYAAFSHLSLAAIKSFTGTHDLAGKGYTSKIGSRIQ